MISKPPAKPEWLWSLPEIVEFKKHIAFEDPMFHDDWGCRRKSIAFCLQDVICDDMELADVMEVVYGGLRLAHPKQLRELFIEAYVHWLSTRDKFAARFVYQIVYVLLRYHYRVLNSEDQ